MTEKRAIGTVKAGRVDIIEVGSAKKVVNCEHCGVHLWYIAYDGTVVTNPFPQHRLNCPEV